LFSTFATTDLIQLGAAASIRKAVLSSHEAVGVVRAADPVLPKDGKPELRKYRNLRQITTS
jgi:hypothetical protein